ncbi:MAG: hypothetical protein KAH14_10800 [Clostridiales bacterium]|nr:hypothetical protein [Clostridiales bacterium]
MVLYGKLMKGNMLLKDSKAIGKGRDKSFHEQMEEAYLQLCKNLDIPVPIWLKKNTREISNYRKTYFEKEQFIEETVFDRFVLEIEV